MLIRWVPRLAPASILDPTILKPRRVPDQAKAAIFDTAIVKLRFNFLWMDMNAGPAALGRK